MTKIEVLFKLHLNIVIKGSNSVPCVPIDYRFCRMKELPCEVNVSNQLKTQEGEDIEKRFFRRP
jgi:hypothetical protein